MNESKSLYCKEKNYVFAEVLSPQKYLRLQIINPQSAKYMICKLQIQSKSLYCKEKNYGFAEVLSPQKYLGLQIINPQSAKYMICKLQICKLLHLQRFPNLKRKFKSANLRICDLRELICRHPPVVTSPTKHMQTKIVAFITLL